MGVTRRGERRSATWMVWCVAAAAASALGGGGVLPLLDGVVRPAHAFFGHRQPPPPEPVEEVDLYEVLGLDEDASQAEIKRAFRQLSLKYVRGLSRATRRRAG